MEEVAFALRKISEQMGLKPLAQIARQPGVRAAYRLTIRYHDRRAADSTATLLHEAPGNVRLEVVYRALFDHRPVITTIDQSRFDAFVQDTLRLGFDKIPDQPNIPPHGVDLWLVERAAGAFVKSLILAPELTAHVYARLVHVITQRLPEAVREVQDPTPKRRAF